LLGPTTHDDKTPSPSGCTNHSLRPIVADEIGILQRDTINSTSPLLNTAVASEAWLRRLNVPVDELNGYWVELHKTPQVQRS